MKIHFVKRVPIPEMSGLCKNVGAVARMNGREGKTLAIVLPCGHLAIIDTWNITGIDTNTPSATPSIFCKGQDGNGCWHGYLTNGELIQV